MSRLISFVSSNTRLAAWLAFGATGLATGAVWASGFATVGGASGGYTESPALAKSPPTSDVNALASTVEESPTPLEYTWTGQWGSIAAPKTLFKVNLSGFDSDKRFNVATLLKNTSDVTGWATLQLKFEKVAAEADGTCLASNFTGSTPEAKVMYFDNQDAGVYWNGLEGGTIHCIGVAKADGDDKAGTFLRAASDAAPAAENYPTFITTVDRTTDYVAP